MTEGNALLIEAEAEPAALQGWVTQRGSVLENLQRLKDEWPAADRPAVCGLIEQMLALDVTLIPRLEAHLENLGKELLATRKIHDALGNSAPARPSSLLIERAV